MVSYGPCVPLGLTGDDFLKEDRVEAELHRFMSGVGLYIHRRSHGCGYCSGNTKYEACQAYEGPLSYTRGERRMIPATRSLRRK